MECKTRKDEMREQVSRFHKENPEVWTLFVKFSREIKSRGFKNYSVNAIFERIRWEKDAGGDGETSFKLNNNYRAFYARRFMRMYPQHDGFFRTREQTSGGEEETRLPELTPKDYYTADNFDLFWTLYPRKEAKGHARKTWAKLVKARILTPTVQRFIVDHLTIRIQDDDGWANGERRYIPHPATWLNSEAWEDEYETLADKKPAPRSLKQMNDSELMKMATDRGIRTAGKTRYELIDKLMR